MDPWPELNNELDRIAQRRGITREDVLVEAVQVFIEADWVDPKNHKTDVELGRAEVDRRKEIREAKLHRSSMFVMPDPDECPDEKLEAWLRMCRGDMKHIQKVIDKELAVMKRVLGRYQEVEKRLVKRMEARGAGSSSD